MRVYLLFADERPIRGFGSLDEAKAAAVPYLGSKSVYIELPAAPAPTAIWRYDPSDGEWVKAA